MGDDSRANVLWCVPDTPMRTTEESSAMVSFIQSSPRPGRRVDFPLSGPLLNIVFRAFFFQSKTKLSEKGGGNTSRSRQLPRIEINHRERRSAFPAIGLQQYVLKGCLSRTPRTVECDDE